ncbi:MAG: hypothetical protein KDD62_12580, partial [Bdellovibrionales bacterium]|nr:hypothetical protein [Bdellovibrionales bacterium]
MEDGILDPRLQDFRIFPNLASSGSQKRQMGPIRFNSCRLSSWFRRFGLFGCALLLASCDPGAYKRGYSEGLDAGFQQGRANGLAEGYANGRSSGLEEGFANGFREGKEEGHKAGKRLGYLAGQKAFLGKHWIPSVALGFCGGVGLLVAYGTFRLSRNHFRWCGAMMRLD